MEKILSICIPVYNGGETAYQHVKEILTYEKDDIEVVVSDNASTDNTLELIKQINDCRLKIVTHEKDVGPFLNWYHALMAGTARYVMLLQDNDRLIVRNLPQYLTFLKNIQYDVIRNIAKSGRNESRELTVAEFQFYGVLYGHASYVAYRREALHSVKPLKCSFNTRYVMCPYIIWDTQILRKYPIKMKKAYLNGEIAINYSPKTYMNRPSRAKQYIEGNDLSYSYKYIASRFSYCIRTLRYLYPKDDEYSKLMCNAYRVYIYLATTGFYRIMNVTAARQMKKRYHLDALDNAQIDYTKLGNDFFAMTVSKLAVQSPIWRVITIIRLKLITLYNQNQFYLRCYERKMKYVTRQARRWLDKLLTIIVDKVCA